jgi:hypothetical protein
MDYLQVAKDLLYPTPVDTTNLLYNQADVDAVILEKFAFLGKRPYWALWGPCGGPMFRVDVLAGLLARNESVTVYNPDKGALWAEYHAFEEMQARYASLGHFVYMGHETRCTATAIEAGVHLFYGNSHFVINDIAYGHVIQGQPLTDAEVDMLNEMRRIIRALVGVVGKPLYESVDVAARALTVDRGELIQNCVLPVSAQKKKAVRTWLSGAGYDKWMVSNDVVISNDPLQALKDALVATIYAQVRTASEPVLTIHLPNTAAWIGQTFNGMEISGRRKGDFVRPVSPYVDEFSVFTPAKVRVVSA